MPVMVLNLFDIIPGRQHEYAEYLRRVEPLLREVGAEIVLYGKTAQTYFADARQKYVGLVRYPNMRALKTLSKHPAFLAARSLRDASLKNLVIKIIDAYPSLSEAIAELDGGG